MTTQLRTLPLEAVPEPASTSSTNGSSRNQLSWYKALYDQHREEEMTLLDYLERCRDHPDMYASPHERLLRAIGAPVVLDTSSDERLSRIFSNRLMRTYPSFAEFYGLEEVIDQIVAFLRHAAQGLEEAKQVLYLLGPVGGGKSSLAERLKELMEHEPFYALKGSPINESPLGLFADQYQRQALQDHYGIPARQVPRVVAVGGQTAAGVQRRGRTLHRDAAISLHAEPDRHRQNRAGRRKQPGHLSPGWQG